MPDVTATAVLHTTQGDITVDLYGLHAPKTVKNFIGLATGEQSWRDPRTGEEVVAFATLRPGSAVTAGDLVAFGREHLSAAKYPRDVRIVDAIPLTSVGKLDRKTLRAAVRSAGD